MKTSAVYHNGISSQPTIFCLFFAVEFKNYRTFYQGFWIYVYIHTLQSNIKPVSVNVIMSY